MDTDAWVEAIVRTCQVETKWAKGSSLSVFPEGTEIHRVYVDFERPAPPAWVGVHLEVWRGKWGYLVLLGRGGITDVIPMETAAPPLFGT